MHPPAAEAAAFICPSAQTGGDSQPISGPCKITCNLTLDFATFACTRQNEQDSVAKGRSTVTGHLTCSGPDSVRHLGRRYLTESGPCRPEPALCLIKSVRDHGLRS